MLSNPAINQDSQLQEKYHRQNKIYGAALSYLHGLNERK